LLVRLSRV